MFLRRMIYGNETCLETKNWIKISQEIRENNMKKDFLLQCIHFNNISIKKNNESW